MLGHNLEKLSKALRVCLQITFAGGLVTTALIWLILRKWFSWYFWNDATYYYACVTIFSACGLCALYILWQLIGLLKTIDRHDPFIEANVRGLRRIAYCAWVIAALFAVMMFFRATILTFAIAYIFLLAGFCFIVLAGLFRRAVKFKTENDLTI